ncbi:ferredoxin-nitrite reductase [compost metagenome]
MEEEWQHIKEGPAPLTEDEYQRVAAAFEPPAYASVADNDLQYQTHLAQDSAFARWVSCCVKPHKVPGYASVVLSTKPGAVSPPGDLTAAQMEAVADWSEQFGFGEIRIAHEQNLILPDVRKQDLHAL